MNLKLKFKEHKINMTKRRLTGTVSVFCCFFLNTLIIWVPFFQIVWTIELTSPNVRQTTCFLPQPPPLHFLVLVTLSTFSSTLKNLPLFFVTVAMLLLCQSPDDCSSREVEGNFTHNASYRYYCRFPGLEFM